jgi:hypothetical protein
MLFGKYTLYPGKARHGLINFAPSALALIQQGEQNVAPPLWLTVAQTWAEIIWRGATVLAIVAGGLFAYYKFWRGREFAKRIEPTLAARTATRSDGMLYLRAEASVKNIGLSKVSIDHASTCITVELLRRGTVDWEELESVFRVFQGQDTLEPNEVVGGQFLIPIPDGNYLAAKLYLNFFATGHNAWRAARRASSLVDLAESADNPTLF